MSKKNFVLFLTGPTGVGKTELSLKIGEAVHGEIINSDVGQFYQPLMIGTAKPEWNTQVVPHYMFDILDSPCNYSVAAYREKVISLIDDICGRGKIPIVVGGSGFYLKSLLFPVQEEGGSSPAVSGTWDQLNNIDPVRASKISKNDYYRINRALSLWFATGTLPSHCKPLFCTEFTYDLVYVGRTRSELYKRIDSRVLSMVQAGLIDEVKSILGSPWEDFIKKKKLIGYNEVIDFIYGKLSFEDMIIGIQSKTRQYAKRQEIYWRHFAKELVAADTLLGRENRLYSIALPECSIDTYCKELITYINNKDC